MIALSTLALFAANRGPNSHIRSEPVMDPKKFIEPKEIEIDGARYVISRIPAVQAQQIYGAIMRETNADGDVAMTYLSEETSLALLSYSAYVTGSEGDDAWSPLEDANQINFACPKIDFLIKLEAAMIRYNFGFLFDGTLQEVLGVLRDENPDTSEQP